LNKRKKKNLNKMLAYVM